MAIKEKYKVYIRIIIPSFTAVLLFIIATYFMFIPQFEKNLFEARKQATMDMAQVGWSLIDNYNRKYKQGLLNLEEAKSQAIQCIENLNYGPGKKDYFWITDTDINMIMHPHRKELNGTWVGDYAGPDGHLVFKEFTNIADSANAGFSTYYWQYYDDSTLLSEKISYVKLHSDWDWVIGTGVYIDDFRRDVAYMKRKILFASIGIIVVFILILLYSIRESLLIDKKREKAEKENNALNDSLERQVIQIKEALDRAERSDQLKDIFLKNLSHEIRTPLNAIVGFSGLLKKESNTLNREQLEDYTSIISQNSDQLLSIVTDILTISSLQTGLEPAHISRIEVNQTLIQVHKNYVNIAAKNNLKLNLNLASKKPIYIFTDRTKLTQIISNLVNNAIKYTSAGKIEISYEIQEHELLFKVEDTGIGIEKEYHTFIFERFGQIENNDDKSTGTGLGLSICKSFAEILDGKIWVESEPEVGSTFYLTIPYSSQDKGATAETASKSIVKKETHSTIKDILVAEDELYNFKLIEAILKSEKYKCYHAANGQAAIDMCQENPNFDLILMDIKMPEIDGETAFQKIREFRPTIPIIAQTAYAMETDKQRFLDMGFTDYISKPIIRLDLLEKINNALY